MFTQRLNDLRITFQIRPIGPFLIKEGRHLEQREGESTEEVKRTRRFMHRGDHIKTSRVPRHPRRHDAPCATDYDTAEGCFNMAFVHTHTTEGDRFYIPGSSLRGIVRHTAERLIGRWQPTWTCASDPFTNRIQQWVDTQREQKSSPSATTLYALAGPIERCFGYTALRGRWVFSDAWMQDEVQQPPHVLVRDGVGIDRQTGAARQGVKYAFEALATGQFETTLTLVNYELWQLGLLAHVLAALDTGEVRMGYGTQRGLGRVQIRVTTMRWRWYVPLVSYFQPDALVRIPTLAALAQSAGMPSAYDWRDGNLRLELPLDHKVDFPVPTWQMTFPANTPTDWDVDPWPKFGRLLPDVLTKWSLPEQLQQKETES
jgi:CRISPR/Cas system CSM-associated protein Csm3 (group 7 of RAMP superfamily)